MMEIGKEQTSELLIFCSNLVRRTFFELSQNKNDADVSIMSNILSNDLIESFSTMTYDDVDSAFKVGVRTGDQYAVNPKTWFIWLNVRKKKNGLKINKLFQDNQAIQIEYNSSNTDRSADHKEYVLNVVVTKYEEWLNFKEPKSRFGNHFKLSGVKMQYEWFDTNGFINITPEDAATLRRKVRGSIKHENGSSTTLKYKIDNACREHLINELYAELKEGKVNLREQAIEILNEKT